MSKTVEEIIKEDTDKFINGYRKDLKEKAGYDLTSLDEGFIRTGITQGILIACRALANIDTKFTMGE